MKIPYKHYVISTKEIHGAMRGMAVAGPFDTHKEADAWVSALTPEQHKEYPICQLSVGPADLGPQWPINLALWKKGMQYEQRRTCRVDRTA